MSLVLLLSLLLYPECSSLVCLQGSSQPFSTQTCGPGQVCLRLSNGSRGCGQLRSAMLSECEVYTQREDCYCDTNLCNGPAANIKSFTVLAGLVVFIIISNTLLYRVNYHC